MAEESFPPTESGPGQATTSTDGVSAVPAIDAGSGDRTSAIWSGQGTSEAIWPPKKPAGEPSPRRHAHARRKKRPWGRVFWIVFFVAALGVIVASRISLNEYALLPGDAQSVKKFITVPPSLRHPTGHPVLLTDVQIGPVTALNYLYYKFQSDVSLVSQDAVTGGVAPSEFNAQGALEMDQAEASAKAAALRHLGYVVPAHPGGAVVFGIFPGTPAFGVLDVGDVVTAVGHVPTPTALAFKDALDPYASGQTVQLMVKRKNEGPSKAVSIRLENTRVSLGFGQYATVKLGIEPQNQVNYTFPVDVTIDVTNIGGPSAGLAMTLGVIDDLTPGSLTGNHTVAATGTMDANGRVGDVGGVAQKTVAVEKAGATIFFVPVQEYKAARSQDIPSLKIYPVSTLDQVLRILARNGGSVPVTKVGGKTSTTTPAS